MKVKISILIILIGISFTNWNCGVVGDILDGDDNPAQYAISSSSYNVTPFETVTLTIDDYVFTQESYYAEIYDKELELIKISDSSTMFLVVCLFVVSTITIVIKSLINLQKRWIN